MNTPKIKTRTIPTVAKLHAHPLIHNIYASRGVSEQQQISAALKDLERPESLSNIKKAMELLVNAFKQQSNILIVGDYDVDGATSTALMIRVLKAFGYETVNYITPNRFKLGYGFSLELLKKISIQETDLIITVDNGISSIEAIEEAKKQGFKVLVTDHHLPSNILPVADAIVNPNLVGDVFPCKNLAGVGVVFYILLQLRKVLTEQKLLLKDINLANYLDLVALGTVADVVSLDSNNRNLVKNGIRRINAGNCCEGIKALCEISGRPLTTLVSSDLGFALGPRLNAAGRLEDIESGIECLLTDNPERAVDYAKMLDDINKQRRDIEADMKQQAEAQLNAIESTMKNSDNFFAITLYHKEWHEGVIGILAARVKEKKYRPTIIFTDSHVENEIKGSARSIPEIHIRDVLEQINAQHPNLILNFGGHAMAAGLTIPKDRATEFTLLFDSAVKHICNAIPPEASLEIDGELDKADFTLTFAQQLQQAGPWGQNFPEPLFMGEFVIVQIRILGEKHTKLMLQYQDDIYVDAILFNQVLPQMVGDTVTLVYKLDINYYQGNESLQLMVQQVVE